MNINKKISIVILIAIALTIVFSLSSVSAGTYGSNGFEVNNNEADTFTELGAKNSNIHILSNDKKVPKNLKKYENVTKFQVTKGNKISYRASVNLAGDGLVSNLKNTKVNGATINFGDKTKVKKGTGWISHAYKKAGWYLIKVNMNATCTSYDLMWQPNATGIGKINNGTKYFLVYVADKPQLVYTKIAITAKSQKDIDAYNKKGQINYLSVTIKNIGSKSTRATKISIFYADSKKLALNKVVVDKNLKKYTGIAKLKALKPGKSTNVVVKFIIPKRYGSKKIILKLDSANKNKNQASKANNMYLING